MLMPAPSDAASPTAKAVQLLWVANAAANTGASVETEPSIRDAADAAAGGRRKLSSEDARARRAELDEDAGKIDTTDWFNR